MEQSLLPLKPSPNFSSDAADHQLGSDKGMISCLHVLLSVAHALKLTAPKVNQFWVGKQRKDLVPSLVQIC